MKMYLKSSKMFVMSETLKISRATDWIFSQFVWEKRRTATQRPLSSILLHSYYISFLYCIAMQIQRYFIYRVSLKTVPTLFGAIFASSISRAEICWPYLCILVNTQTFYFRTYFWVKYLQICESMSKSKVIILKVNKNILSN